MEFSILVARILGIYLIVISLALLSNKSLHKAILNLYKNKVVLFGSGLFNVLLGSFLILYHNYWTGDWRVAITLFGWGALAKGIMRIFWPNKTLETFKKTRSDNWQKFLLIGTFLLGLYLVYYGLAF